MTRFNPDTQIKRCQDEALCFNGQAPTIAAVKNAYGETIADSWIEIQLNDISEFCGVKDKMDTRQMEQLAQIIRSQYGYLKISELMLFFVQFKSGRYGRFYGSVDPMVISNALADFMAYRRSVKQKYEAEREREQRKAQDEIVQKAKITYQEYLKRHGERKEG